jgi:hypothetical protein
MCLFSFEDDFDGKFCGQGKYPLINSVKANFLDGVQPQVPSTTRSSEYKIEQERRKIKNYSIFQLYRSIRIVTIIRFKPKHFAIIWIRIRNDKTISKWTMSKR